MIAGTIELVENGVVVAHRRDLDQIGVELARVPDLGAEVLNHHAKITVRVGVRDPCPQQVVQLPVDLAETLDANRQAVLVLTPFVEGSIPANLARVYGFTDSRRDGPNQREGDSDAGIGKSKHGRLP